MTEAAPGPGSRWRGAEDRARPTGAANRVRESQRHARASLRLSLTFVVAAGVSTLVPHPGGRWLPLHLFLAGGAVLAIGAATTLFTVTWSAAPAPGRPAAAVQRWLVAVGAAVVTAARTWEWPSPVLVAGAVAFAGGLVLLAALLVTTVRRGVERRYDAAAAWYVAALGAGAVAVVLGTHVATGGGDVGPRQAHVALNLLGLVGLVLGGTLPSFAATVGRVRMWSGATPARHLALLGWQTTSLVAVALGAALEADGVQAAGLAAQAAGAVGLAVLAPRITRRQLRWAGPRLLALHLGLLWWGLTLVAAACRATEGEVALAGRLVPVLAIGGLAQILWGSLCYLLPVLRGGGHERLTAGFATTRSWTALAAVNVAAVALATEAPLVAGLALAAFAGESAVRFGLVLRR